MKTHILFILDKSASMLARRQETISGFNEYLHDIQNDSNLKKVRMSLTLFDTTFNDVFVNIKLEDVQQLDDSVYMPGGMTALYDAIAHMLISTLAEVKEKQRALVVILTDGEENSSKEHSRQQIFDMIKQYENKGNYTFVFLGCDQDVWAEGGKMGVPLGNTKDFDANDIQSAYRGLSQATSNYGGGKQSQSSLFWDDGIVVK